MSLYSFETLEPSPKPHETLTVLAAALGDQAVPAVRRVIASPDSRSPDEGLALLNAYVAIQDAHLRQAILDAVLGIAGTNSYR